MEPQSQPATLGQPDLTTLVTGVLGDLAFMINDDQPAETPLGTVWMEGEVRYLGPREGSLRCWCTRDFAIKLAANLLGVESAGAEAQVAAEDAVRELMNILCGQLVTMLYGTKDVYNLSIPQVRECLDAPQPSGTPGEVVCQLSIEGEPFACTHQCAS